MKRGREVQNITDQYVKHYRIFFLGCNTVGSVGKSSVVVNGGNYLLCNYVNVNWDYSPLFCILEQKTSIK